MSYWAIVIDTLMHEDRASQERRKHRRRRRREEAVAERVREDHGGAPSTTRPQDARASVLPPVTPVVTGTGGKPQPSA